LPAKKISYNLPGFGMLSIDMYPYTQMLFDFLSQLGYENKFHETNQLGSLRDIFPGAHHTRYEYIYLQWSLICALQAQKHLGLNSERKEFGKVRDLKEPTGAEILQCLVLLCNMGHFPETFGASRALLHIIQKDKSFKKGFRRGVEDSVLFKKYVDRGDVYNIHHLVALFLLNRYRRYRRSSDYVSFAVRLLKAYLKQDETDSAAVKNLWELYRGVRTLSFLILDAMYSPIPLTLDVSSILLDFDNVFEDIFIKSSSLQIALRQLEIVLQDIVYLNPNALLATERVSERILGRFTALRRNWSKLSVVRDLLEPMSHDPDVGDVFNRNRSHFTPPDWDPRKILQVDYQNIENYEKHFPKDLVEWERSIRNAIGKNSCRVGAQYDPRRSLFRVAFGINQQLDERQSIQRVMDFIAQVNKFNVSLPPEYRAKNLANNDNKERMYRFLIKAAFGWKCSTRLEWVDDPNGEGPFFFARGTVTVCKAIRQYISRVIRGLSSDKIHELKLTEKVLSSLPYRGLVFVYVGSTRLRLNGRNSRDDAEFDGVVFFPQKDPNDYFLIVVEAKNQSFGHTSGKGQLSDRLKTICEQNPHITYDIVPFANEGAYAKIRLTPN